MHLMSGRSSHHREGKSTQPSQVRLLLRQPASGGINTGRCDTIQCDTFGTLLVYATGMDFGTAPFTSSRFPHRVSVSLVCFLDPLGVLYHRSRNWRVAGFMPALLYPLAPSTVHTSPSFELPTNRFILLSTTSFFFIPLFSSSFPLRFLWYSTFPVLRISTSHSFESPYRYTAISFIYRL